MYQPRYTWKKLLFLCLHLLPGTLYLHIFVLSTPYTDTHTHPFNGPFSGTTRVSRYQKCKTNLDFTEARDSERQWHQLGYMQVCTSLQTTTPAPHHSPLSTPYQRKISSVPACFYRLVILCQHATTQFFTGRMPFLPLNQQCQSTEGNITYIQQQQQQQQQQQRPFNGL